MRPVFEPQNTYAQPQIQDNDDIQIIDVPVQPMPVFNNVIEPQVIPPVVNDSVQQQSVQQVQQYEPWMMQQMPQDSMLNQGISTPPETYVSTMNTVPVQPRMTQVEQVMPQMNTQPEMAIPQNYNVAFINSVPVEPVPIIDILQDEPADIPNQSFTEMAFAGVNQQQEEAKRVTILESQPTVMNVDDQVDRSSNMEPIQKQEDENAGLKFLLVLGIIFAVVIILLPYL